jgi:hypothetical protein
MTLEDDQLSLVFDLDRKSPFFFKCQKCSVCCSNRTIKLEPYELLRISRNLGITTKEFLKTYVEDKSPILCNKPNGECIFLASNGCGIHSHRPLVCRLYPLGLIWDSEGKERFSSMPPHPDCLGFYSDEGTVEAYLESQGVELYFYFEKKYSPIYQKIAAKFLSFRKQTLKAHHAWKLEGLGDNSVTALLPHLFDIDTTVTAFCQKHRIELPVDLDEIVEAHIQALSVWLDIL